MNLLRLKFRRRIFRAFQTWYAKKAGEFVRKLSVIKRDSNSVEMGAEGIPHQVMRIEFRVSRGLPPIVEITAYFYLNGECFDFGGWLDAHPLRVDGGFRCRMCQLESTNTTYPKLENLWIDHLFEPLLVWVNESLSNLVRVDFCQTRTGGSKWVALIRNENGQVHQDSVASFVLPPPRKVFCGHG